MTGLTLSFSANAQNTKDNVNSNTVRCYDRAQREEIANRIYDGEKCCEESALKDSTIERGKKVIQGLQEQSTKFQLLATEKDSLAQYYKVNLEYWKDKYDTEYKDFKAFKRYTTFGGIGVGVLFLTVLIAK